MNPTSYRIAVWAPLAALAILMLVTPAVAKGKPAPATPHAAKSGKPVAAAPAPAVPVAAAEPPAAKAPAAKAPVAAAAPPAKKYETYEDARADALGAGDLAPFLEPLYAECKQKSDLARRQCEQIRAFHVARLHEKTWHAVADAAALQSQPYDAAEKSITLAVTGCLACDKPPVIAGSPRLVVTKPPKGFESGAPVGLDLAFYEVPIEGPTKVNHFLTKIRPRLRVEFLFTVGQPYETKDQKGVLVTPIAHRVYDMCTGEVIASAPRSEGAVSITTRDPSCPAAGALSDEELELRREQAALPDALARADIERSMAPVQARIFDCAQEFELSRGVVRVTITLHGDGKRELQIDPPYNEGNAALCVRAAMKDAKFPRFKTSSPAMKINYPFVLRK